MYSCTRVLLSCNFGHLRVRAYSCSTVVVLCHFRQLWIDRKRRFLRDNRFNKSYCIVRWIVLACCSFADVHDMMVGTIVINIRGICIRDMVDGQEQEHDFEWAFASTSYGES